MRIAVAALVLAAATITTAAAQPALTSPTPREAAPEIKSESAATALALGSTLGGLALAYEGAQHDDGSVVFGGVALMLIGPSAGHFYAGETAHGAKMSL